MAAKGTIFDQFTSQNYDFLGNFQNLLNSFLSSIGNTVMGTQILGNFSLNDIMSGLSSFNLGNLLGPVAENLINSAITQFSSLASDSLTALYNSAQGFVTNVVTSYMDAIISQIYIPEDVFLWNIKQLQSTGSDPNLDNVLLNACLRHDLVKTISWLDAYNSTKYSIFEPQYMNRGVLAAQYGSWNVACYILDQIVASWTEYMNVPIDKDIPAQVNTQAENNLTYNFYIHSIVKNIFVNSYSNLLPADWATICNKYNIDPAAFGSTDTKFASRCLITSSDINKLAPFYTGGIMGIIDSRFKNSLQETYIAPINNNIKYLYLFLWDKSKFGDRVIYNAPLHQRLRSIIISSYLKALSDASSSLLTTGLGKYIVDPSTMIAPLIENLTKTAEPYLFDPSKQVYVMQGDSVNLPPEILQPVLAANGASASSTARDYNQLGNIDLSKFRVYCFENMPSDGILDITDFKNQVMQQVFNILNKGQYHRFDIFTTRRLTRIYSSINATFTGLYSTVNLQFYVFSTFAPSATDASLCTDSFQSLTMKYLIDEYGLENISWLIETYPDLPFTAFVTAWQAELENTTLGYGNLTNPSSADLSAGAALVSTLFHLYSNPTTAANDANIMSNEIALDAKVVALTHYINSIQNPAAVTLSACKDYQTFLDTLMILYNSGKIQNISLGSDILLYQAAVQKLLILSGKAIGVAVSADAAKLATLLSDNTTTTITADMIVLINKITSGVGTLVNRAIPASIDSALPDQLQTIVKALTILSPTSPTSAEADQLAAMSQTLTNNMNNLILAESNSSVTIKNQFEVQKTLTLSRVQYDLRVFKRYFSTVVINPSYKDAAFLTTKWNVAAQDIHDMILASFESLFNYETDLTIQTSMTTLMNTYLSTLGTTSTAITNFLATNSTNITAWNGTTVATFNTLIKGYMKTVFSSTLCALYDDCLTLCIQWGSTPVTNAKALSTGIHDALMNLGLVWHDSLNATIQAGTIGGVTAEVKARNDLTTAFNAYSQTSAYATLRSSAPVASQTLLDQFDTSIIADIAAISTQSIAYMDSIASQFLVFSDHLVQNVQEAIWEIIINQLNQVDLKILSMKQAVRPAVTTSDIANLVNQIQMTQNTIATALNSLGSTTPISGQITDLSNGIAALRGILSTNPDLFVSTESSITTVTTTPTITVNIGGVLTQIPSAVQKILLEIEAMFASHPSMDESNNVVYWQNNDGTFMYPAEMMRTINAIQASLDSQSTAQAKATPPKTPAQDLADWRSKLKSVGDIDIEDPDAFLRLYSMISINGTQTGRFVYTLIAA